MFAYNLQDKDELITEIKSLKNKCFIQNTDPNSCIQYFYLKQLEKNTLDNSYNEGIPQVSKQPQDKNPVSMLRDGAKSRASSARTGWW